MDKLIQLLYQLDIGVLNQADDKIEKVENSAQRDG